MATTDFTADEQTFVVIPALAYFGTVEVGQQFTTNQTVELFMDEAAARLRAVEIGWVDESLEGEEIPSPDDLSGLPE